MPAFSRSRISAEDLAAAIAFVLEHADELRVSRSGYSLWGSSAGARMAETVEFFEFLQKELRLIPERWLAYRAEAHQHV